MAFYTSRIDERGYEIEKRPSARSLASSLSSTSTHLSLSSRSCDTSSSVRYVNPAAFIEKNTEMSDGVSNRKCHSVSETQSDIVPPLDLQSEDNYPTTRDYTFSYRKHCEAAKIVLKPDQAYETWLSAKRKLLTDAASKRKKAEEQKRRELEERKRLSEKKFQQWLETKTRSQKQFPPQSNTTINSSNQTMKSVNSSEFEKTSRAELSEQQVHACLEEWQRKKQLQEERQRMIKRQEEKKRKELEEKRRQVAADAWEKWLADAAKKPKPVPLNRGILTLRGTISDIFVNPNEWQPILPIPKED